MCQKSAKLGDFSGLAENYPKSRPDYSPSVLNGLIGLLKKPLSEIDFVDVGAGTGIWTRMVYNKGIRSAVAVEPNKDMFVKGKCENQGALIHWIRGSAEQLDLPDSSKDWITMASSFHWTNYETATREFARILRRGGHFTALWNPRLIEINPLLVEIESYLQTLGPNIKRVSSGLSGITETLTEQLLESSHFEDIVYMEGRHVIAMTPERYLTAWKSVNDIRFQLGSEKFDDFLRFIQKRVSHIDIIEATYLTRAWSASRKD